MRALPILFLGLATCCPPATTPAKPTTTTATPPKTVTPPPSPTVTLEALTENQATHGFHVVARYAGEGGKPLGARFVHDQTHFIFDYLRIESAPQGFIWVTTYPTSDQGEPHTQEHLLLGKGDRGRKFGSSMAMELGESTAFTDQWRTCYSFHTTAANEVFWPVFADQLDAMLNPDYSDEEIRREVRNFGVDKTGDGTLHLEEKGTVYNEMTRAYESPDAMIWRRMNQLVYGAKHPLALESGGFPAAIRTMTPADIRTFHAANYHLANMGMIAAFPSAMALPDVLDRTSQLLVKEAGRQGKVTTEAELPKPAGAPTGTNDLVDYPFATTTNAGPLMLAWPATRDLALEDRVLLALFLDAVGGDASTSLYKRLIDGKTRVLDTGATALGFHVSEDQGEVITLALDGVRAEKLDRTTITAVRAQVHDELARIAQLPDGDPELAALGRRVGAHLIDLRRHLAKTLDTPPRFGFRGGGTEWMDLLRQASRAPGFTKSLLLAEPLASIEKLVAAPGNPWRERVARWGLLDAPYGLAARGNPDLRKQIDADRQQRVATELARLATQYGTHTDKDTLAKLAVDEGAATAKIDEVTKQTPLPPLVATPPMTSDPGLVYDERTVGQAHVLTAHFDNMASAQVSLAFGIQGVDPDDYPYLAMLPQLMTQTGVIDGQTVIGADEMQERIRREILDLDVRWTASHRTNRIELVVSGAGGNPTETARALAWMELVMHAPNWRLDNLPRLRDVVAQTLTGVRQRMTRSEETWVTDPRDAWDRQGDRAYLHTSSFLTRAHDLHRLRWQLEDPQDPKVSAEAVAFLRTLAAKKALPRAKLLELAKRLATTAKLSPGAAAIARDAGHDLAELLGDLPDTSLAADWAYLCDEMASDLALGAPAALAKLAAVRESFFVQRHTRGVVVGSTAHAEAIDAPLEAVLGRVRVDARKAGYPRVILGRPLVDRLAEHDASAAKDHATFVGLVAPSTSSGVFVHLARATGYADTSDDAVLDYLTSNTFTGHGAHSIFMKTWAAGLAYSNGLHPHVDAANLDYYAERCPLLPQTMRFVIAQIEEAAAGKPDANIARYAIASAFASRVADTYEARAAAMSADLADAVTPEIVKTFRTRLLQLTERADLAALLFSRLRAVYAKVLPGLGAIDPTATYLVIGPDKQLDAYQQYLQTGVAKVTALHKLYPRDFWLPAHRP